MSSPNMGGTLGLKMSKFIPGKAEFPFYNGSLGAEGIIHVRC